MSLRLASLGLLVLAAVAVVDIARYAREQTQRADGWREEYFALLDVVDHVHQHTPEALEGSGWR